MNGPSRKPKSKFDYHILEAIEAGLVLTGSEVKSLRNGQCQLKDSYVNFQNQEAFLVKAHISEYKASSYLNHAPERPRKLLLKAAELAHIRQAIREQGLTVIPLRVYLKNGWIKVAIGLAKGKKDYDKREAIKKREAESEISSRQHRQRRA